MKKGIVIFAHNSRKVDYSLMSIIAGGLAKKHLQLPVSLITDQSTMDWMSSSSSIKDAESIFDQIIITERPYSENYRTLSDGNLIDNVPFINNNRYSVWNLTPYDRTLLIDSDFLIFSDRLKSHIDCDIDLMIGESMIDLGGNRVGTLDRYVSDTGPNLYWATNVVFTKNENTKIFFDLVDYIKENYSYYCDLFRFYPRPYRNDISFSVAKHILDGYSKSKEQSLPPIPTTTDKDLLVDIDANGKLIFLINQGNDDYIAISIKNQDVHVMNKQSLIRNSEVLLKLI